MLTSYSIAEARNRLAALVHDAEEGRPIELTRRGKRVAVLLSVEQFDRAVRGKASFWDALTTYRAQVDLRDMDVDEIFQDVRDVGSGRKVEW